MTKFRGAVATLLLASMAGTVQAETDSGFYVSGFIGLGAPGDAELTGTQNPEAGAPGVAGAPANIGVEYDSDLNFGVAIGYDTGWEFFDIFQPRLELEYSRIDADVSDGAFNAGNQPFSGDTSVDFFLINNYTDIVWQDDQTIIPFFGGGLGIGTIDANILYAGGGATEPNFAARGDDSGLAGTIAAGVTFETADSWDLYGEARYYQIRDIELERRFIAGGADLLNAKVEDDFDGFTFAVGVRRRF